jgi:hypothetical protein
MAIAIADQENAQTGSAWHLNSPRGHQKRPYLPSMVSDHYVVRKHYYSTTTQHHY